jgi:hypothetical protein
MAWGTQGLQIASIKEPFSSPDGNGYNVIDCISLCVSVRLKAALTNEIVSPHDSQTGLSPLLAVVQWVCDRFVAL